MAASVPLNWDIVAYLWDISSPSFGQVVRSWEGLA